MNPGDTFERIIKGELVQLTAVPQTKWCEGCCGQRNDSVCESMPPCHDVKFVVTKDHVTKTLLSETT